MQLNNGVNEDLKSYLNNSNAFETVENKVLNNQDGDGNYGLEATVQQVVLNQKVIYLPSFFYLWCDLNNLQSWYSNIVQTYGF